MKRINWFNNAIICIGLLQAVACTKTSNDVQCEAISLESSSNVTVGNEFSNCKLRYIIHEHGAIQELIVTGLFTYNAAGNPYSLTYDKTGTGNPNHYFLYDKRNRLREYRIGFYHIN